MPPFDERSLVPGPPFDALASADFLVPDRDAAVAAVQQALGFVEPKPRWSFGWPGRGFEVTFCRPTPALRHSPTLVELITDAPLDPSRPLTEVVPNVAGLVALQGDRPLKTHGAPVGSTDVDDLIERVRGRGLRHWVQPSSRAYPFRRLWMGINEDGLADYRTGTDGGLMLEVVDTRTLGLPEELVADTSTGGDRVPVGMVRTSTRCFLVDDLDRSLGELAATFDWEPELGPETSENGSRRAVLGVKIARSARIELVQPGRGTDEVAYLTRFGPGVWAVRIAVSDLGAKAGDLRARGTPYTEVRTGFERPQTVLRVDTAATPGCLFEFEPV